MAKAHTIFDGICHILWVERFDLVQRLGSDGIEEGLRGDSKGLFRNSFFQKNICHKTFFFQPKY